MITIDELKNLIKLMEDHQLDCIAITGVVTLTKSKHLSPEPVQQQRKPFVDLEDQLFNNY